MEHEVVMTPILSLHLFAGIGALLLGTILMFVMEKGTNEHKKVGIIWSFLMAFLALSSLIDLLNNGWVSMPAHIFTLITIILLPIGIWAAKNAKMKLHKICMFILYIVLLAATLALLLVPGRLFNVWFGLN